VKLLGGVLKAIAPSTGAPAATAGSALWTFPSIIGSAVVIAWAAEAAQFLISQGMALAILAWLQTLPEFAVEAVIAYQAPRIPDGVALISANFTGSLRLLVGLGWPMIYVVAAWSCRRKHGRPLRQIDLEGEHAVEVLALFLPLIYFMVIWAKGTLTILDAAVLAAMYVAYLFVLNKIPPQDQEKIEDMEVVPRTILGLRPWLRNATIIGLFAAGGLILYFVAEPFLHSMLALAVSLGMSQYMFVQWVAPFLSEFPEKVSAFYWARKITGAPMALMNMVSSNVNQWSMLVAMIPIVYSASLNGWGILSGGFSPVVFDHHQRVEILLTISQSALAFILLCNMSFAWYEAAGLFGLWFVQFVIPPIHEWVTAVYFLWCAVEVALFLAGRRTFRAFGTFAALWREHGRKDRPVRAGRSRG
jgi:cation:H+ antiporter